MGNTCCGDGKGRKMTFEAIVKLQGWARSMKAKQIIRQKLMQWLVQIGDIESPRSGAKLIDRDTIERIVTESLQPGTRRYLITSEENPGAQKI